MKHRLRPILAALSLILAATFALPATGQRLPNPKREFRGAWIQVVNGQLKGLSTADAQAKLARQLDACQEAGLNVIFFQVRAEADALYASDIEPWSRYLTGTQGQAPNPLWDPLQWMIDQCHSRGMELHAWINPYRAFSSVANTASPNHISQTDPALMVAYGNQLLFDPACEGSIQRICQVVEDIVSRYDVDGIHMDDYFYPYPIAGQEYPDQKAFEMLGRGYSNKGDWRRDNVNRLIEQLHALVSGLKPWVAFGVSPFGIYRNRASDPDGSETRGLQNYDDLYADVLLWAEQGWVDYLIPQIYWHIGHPVADYAELVDWWARHTGGRPLYIGQSIPNTVENADPADPHSHQLRHKMRLQRRQPTIGGSCQWYAAALVDNPGNYTSVLKREYHNTPALLPAYDFISNRLPGKVRKLKGVWTSDGYHLFWTEPKHHTELDRAHRYVVYRFAKGETVDIEDPTHIVAITSDTHIRLPYQYGRVTYTYVVTAVSRIHNESKAKKVKVKL